MKTIFSRSFLSLLEREDISIKLTKYFVTDCSDNIEWKSFSELISSSALERFQLMGQRTEDKDIIGIWDKKEGLVKISISFDSLTLESMFNGDTQIKTWRIGYFYYKTPFEDEEVAFILLPDDFNGTGILKSTLGLSTFGKNLINIQFPGTCTINSYLTVSSNSDIEFLEGYGISPAVNIFNSNISNQSFVSPSSFEKYLLRESSEHNYKDVSEFLNINGEIERKDSYIRKIISINIDPLPEVIDYREQDINLTGKYTWGEYSISSGRLIKTGISSISFLKEGSFEITGDNTIFLSKNFPDNLKIKENTSKEPISFSVQVSASYIDSTTGITQKVLSNEVSTTQQTNPGEYWIYIGKDYSGFEEFDETGNMIPLYLIGSEKGSILRLSQIFVNDFIFNNSEEDNIFNPKHHVTFIEDSREDIQNLFKVSVEKEVWGQNYRLNIIIETKTRNNNANKYLPDVDSLELPKYILKVDNNIYKFYVVQKADVLNLSIYNKKLEKIENLLIEPVNLGIGKDEITDFAISYSRPLREGESSNWFISNSTFKEGVSLNNNKTNGLLVDEVDAASSTFWESGFSGFLTLKSSISNDTASQISKGQLWITNSSQLIDISNWKNASTIGYINPQIMIKGIHPIINIVEEKLIINRLGTFTISYKSNSSFKAKIKTNNTVGLDIFFKLTSKDQIEINNPSNLNKINELELYVDSLYLNGISSEIKIGEIEFTTTSLTGENTTQILDIFLGVVDDDVSLSVPDNNKLIDNTAIFLDISSDYQVLGQKGSYIMNFFSNLPIKGKVTSSNTYFSKQLYTNYLGITNDSLDIAQGIELVYQRVLPSFSCPISNIAFLEIMSMETETTGKSVLGYPIYPIPIPPKLNFEDSSYNTIYLDSDITDSGSFITIKFTSNYIISNSDIKLEGEGFSYILLPGVYSGNVWDYSLKITCIIINTSKEQRKLGKITITSSLSPTNFSNGFSFKQESIDKIAPPDSLTIDVYQNGKVIEEITEIVITGDTTTLFPAAGGSRQIGYTLPEDYTITKLTFNSNDLSVANIPLSSKLSVIVESRDYVADLPSGESYNKVTDRSISFTIEAKRESEILSKVVTLRQEGISKGIIYRDLDNNISGSIGALSMNKTVTVPADCTSFGFYLGIFPIDYSFSSSTGGNTQIGSSNKTIEGEKITYISQTGENYILSQPPDSSIFYNPFNFPPKSYVVSFNANSDTEKTIRRTLYFEKTINSQKYKFTLNINQSPAIEVEDILEFDRLSKRGTTFHSSGYCTFYDSDPSVTTTSTLIKNLKTNRDVSNFKLYLVEEDNTSKEISSNNWSIERYTNPDANNACSYTVNCKLDANYQYGKIHDFTTNVQKLILKDSEEEIWRTTVYQGYLGIMLYSNTFNTYVLSSSTGAIQLSLSSNPDVSKSRRLNTDVENLSLHWSFPQLEDNTIYECEYITNNSGNSIIERKSSSMPNISIFSQVWNTNKESFPSLFSEDNSNYFYTTPVCIIGTPEATGNENYCLFPTYSIKSVKYPNLYCKLIINLKVSYAEELLCKVKVSDPKFVLTDYLRIDLE